MYVLHDKALTMTKSRTEQILDFAEAEIRKNGFDGVSFRDIAAAIGVKSASVHYHFPTKADLGVAVTKRYAERMMTSLGAPDDAGMTRRDLLARVADVYIAAYRQDTSTCLCAVLGSVVTHLPPETRQEVQQFFATLKKWVTTAMEGADTRLTPNIVVSTMQGAMVLSIATEDDAPLHEAKRHITELA